MCTILIVEDQQDLRSIMRQVLGGTGFEFLEAGDGAIALQLLIEHPFIALVLTDFQMPRMNGLELLNHMKTYPLLRRIPVVVVTADYSPGLRSKALKAGANQVLFKPYDFEELKSCVHTLLAPLQVA